MEILDIDWERFLDALPPFELLPLETRRHFLEKVQPSQSVSSYDLGKHFEVLCASGFMVPGVRGVNATVPPKYRSFSRVMRAMHRYRIFDSPSRESFLAYLAAHFTIAERGDLQSYTGDYYYREQKLYSQIISVEWLNEFLAAPEDKGARHRGGNWDIRGTLFHEVLRATQEVVRLLMTLPSPLALTELRSRWPEGYLPLLSPTLVAGMRNLLFFPAFCGDNLEPVLGLWPSITKRLHRPPPKPPATVAPDHVFEGSFLMDDMTKILALCAAEPFRLRSDNYELYARSSDAIVSSLGTLPGWVEKQLNLILTDRMGRALAFLKYDGFLQRKGEPGTDLRLEVAEEGRNWLALPVKDRLKALLDRLLGKSNQLKESNVYEYDYDYDDRSATLLPYAWGFDRVNEEPAIQAALLAVYSSHHTNTFVSINDFIAFQGQQNNPLRAAVKKRSNMSVVIRGAYVSMPSQEELEDGWADWLLTFLRSRLVPLGAAKLGLDGDGALCFALTEAGKYLLGIQTDFQLEQAAGRIVVQPNFDVVFLGPAVWAEAEIGRFAERKGRHLGTLFKITKRSIQAAAAAGLTAEQTLETLRQCCFGEFPANVQREISGWFAQCRRISVRPAVLIHCPDAETAARVQAIAGKKAALISHTVVELHDPGKQADLLRRLREAGIFVTP